MINQTNQPTSPIIINKPANQGKPTQSVDWTHQSGSSFIIKEIPIYKK